jgi:ABC-type transporter Mla MlaB component
MPRARSLPSEITIYTLGEVCSQWRAWLAKLPKPRRTGALAAAKWPVDASAVEEVDAAGVQLLLSLSHSVSRERRVLELVNPSRKLASALEALGVSSLMTTRETRGPVA